MSIHLFRALCLAAGTVFRRSLVIDPVVALLLLFLLLLLAHMLRLRLVRPEVRRLDGQEIKMIIGRLKLSSHRAAGEDIDCANGESLSGQWGERESCTYSILMNFDAVREILLSLLLINKA